MRTGVAIIAASVGLIGMVCLLMREDTQIWQLPSLGLIVGSFVGAVRWRWRGAAVGAAVGCALGVVAPVLYLPFWLVFTLPPYGR